jgi:thiol:disulfide interchange protein DsbG
MYLPNTIRSVLASVMFAALFAGGNAAPAADRLSGSLLQGGAMQQTAESMLTDIAQASWVRDGNSRHVIYVYFDPNCPYCRRVYDGLRRQVERGEVELRWIPIAVLTITSLGKAAAILEAADPTAALHRNEEHFSTETGSLGGIEEELLPRKDTLARLDRNLALLRRSGRDNVPALLFRNARHQAQFIVGAPPQATLLKIVSDLE